MGLRAGSEICSADSTKCVCLSSGSSVKQDSKAHRKSNSLPQRTKSTLALILKTLTALLTAQVNTDSPPDAASGSGTGSSEAGSAGGAVACLASSISSSSGMTSFIRLWLHTFATSLMSEWRQCKEHAVPGMRGGATAAPAPAPAPLASTRPGQALALGGAPGCLREQLRYKDTLLAVVVGEAGQDSGQDPRGVGQHHPASQLDELPHPAHGRQLDQVVWGKKKPTKQDKQW